MGLFTGVGDFFRGAFGEDEEEKKRRKQREALQAAQVKVTPKPQNPVQRQQVRDVSQMFGSKDKPAEIAKPTPKKAPVAPAPRPTPLPDQKFVGVTESNPKNKTIFGRDVSKQLESIGAPGKTYTVKADREISTNKDKFVASYDKLNPQYQKVLVNTAKEDAKKGNQAAINTLNALEESGRLKGGFSDFVEGSNERFLGGLARGTLRTTDLVLPGVNTFGMEGLADQQDASKTNTRQITSAGKTGETTGTVEKGIVDLAALAIPTSKVDSMLQGAKLIKTMKDGSRLMKVGSTVFRVAPGSLVGSGVDYLQQRGRGDDPNIAQSIGIGLGTDLAVSALPATLRPVINKLRGGTPEERVIAEELAGLTTAGASAASREVADTAVKTAQIPQAQADQLAKKAIEAEKVLEEKGLQNATEQELLEVADNEFANAEKRKAAQDRLKQLKEPAPDPLDTPAFQHRKDVEDIVKREEENLNKYINETPGLTAQQIKEAAQATKDRALQLIKELEDSRYGTAETVTKQGDALTATTDAQKATNEAVAAEQAAKTEPAPAATANTPNETVPGSPEAVANNGYRQSTEDILFGNQTPVQERGRLSIPQLLSPDRIIRENITRPVENAINRGVENLQTSGNKVGQGIGRFFTGFSREAGVAPETQTARMQLRGGVETGKLNREAIADLRNGMDDASVNRVWADLDPEQAGRLGMEAGELSPEEAILRDKLKTIIDNTTAENLRRGLITPEQAAAGYIKRAYTVFDDNPEVTKFEKGFRQELMNQYKGRKKVSDEMVEKAITDPTYLVGKKAAESEALWAMQDYGNYLSTSGIVSDVPKPGYVQLPSTPIFGDAAGKYVPQNISEDFTGFQYSHAMTSAFNDMITAYDSWGIRQAKKQLLTIFNPAVRLGNQVTNRGIFSQLNGINPVQFNIAMHSVDSLIKSNAPIYREAVAQGLTGIDITQAEFFAKRVGDSTGDRNLAKKALDWTKTSYSAADDKARVAAFAVYRNRGYSPEDAARMVQRGFQDYKSVGFFYDMAAKTPFIGNAFVRFVADSIRIAKNAAVDHPLRTVSTIALWSAFVNGMSVASGESSAGDENDNVAEKTVNLFTGSNKSDKQKQREDRFGAPKLPFTDISMAVQTPFGEVNVARFMPWYQLNDVNSGVSKFLPISQSPVILEDGKPQFNGAGFADPVLGQFAQMAADKDFRNKSIQDPTNTDNKFRRDPLSTEDKLKNLARWFGVNNAPLGKEIDQTASAVMGVPDLYGKDRTVPQAIARDFGFKVETYGDEQLKRAASINQYQEEKAQIDEELKKLSPDAQESYKRLTGYDKLRETVPNEFDPTTDRFKKAPVYDFSEDKWKEYAAHPELYQLMVNKKQREAAKEDGAPLQPEFDPRLSESFRKQLIQNKMVAPGDDAELDQRMYSSPEWDYYQALKDQYKAKANDYYPENDDYTDELVKHQDAQFPTKPGILKQYGAQYGLYTSGKAVKPEFTDAVKAAKEAYNKQTFDWTNTERQARGLPAINWDVWNNPTFGFDSTPSMSGFGFGGGGSSYDPAMHVNTLGELTNYSASVDRLDPIQAAELPSIVQLFAKLKAGSGGGRQKPRLGASSSGR